MTSKGFLILFKQLFLYGIIGLFSSTIDALFFHFLIYKLGVYSVIANVFSVILGILISFILNLNFNFKIKNKIIIRFFSFLVVGLFGLLLSTMIIALGEKSNWNIFITKIISIFIVAIVQFILNKFISFKNKNN